MPLVELHFRVMSYEVRSKEPTDLSKLAIASEACVTCSASVDIQQRERASN